MIEGKELKLKNKFLLHNDLNLGNIIYDGEKIILIDFDSCAKGDWIIDFKKELKNNNDFFDGLFLSYWKTKNCYSDQLMIILSLYEYYYMKQLVNEQDSNRRNNILERHQQFLEYCQNRDK